RHPPDLHSFPTRRSSDLGAICLDKGPIAPLVDDHPPGFWRLTFKGHPMAVESCRAGEAFMSTSTVTTNAPSPNFATGQTGKTQRSEEHTSELQSRENLVC